jgi:hypothetical protein
VADPAGSTGTSGAEDLELNPGLAAAHDHYGWLCSALGRYDDETPAVAEKTPPATATRTTRRPL